MDVQAGAGISLTDILTLQYTVTATFQPTMDTQYWVDSYLGDFIWSNTYGTQAQLDSVTSETYIDPGDCGTSCDIADALAQGTTSLGPISIPYDPANSIAGAVNSYLLSAYWGTDSTQLYAADTYTLVHQTTFNISGLAPSEVIRIDLPEDSNLSGAAVLTHAPEPATWGLALLGIGLAGFRLRKRSR
jgi:MYXO-CTERM domain-containing protein